EVPTHRGAEVLGRLTQARLGVRAGPRLADHAGLLGDHGDGEALDPLGVDLGLGGHLGDRLPGPQPGLDLARREQAVAGTVAAVLLAATRLLLAAAGFAVADALRLGDGAEQLGVKRHQEPARLRTLARAEDEPLEVGREPDEMELLHPRSYRPALRTSSLGT